MTNYMAKSSSSTCSSQICFTNLAPAGFPKSKSGKPQLLQFSSFNVQLDTTLNSVLSLTQTVILVDSLLQNHNTIFCVLDCCLQNLSI